MSSTIQTSIPTFDPKDVALLTNLGLHSINLELSQETLLGHVHLQNQVKVSIWATSTPAVFFRFDFQFPDSKQYRAQTGSGSFRTFWETAKRFAEDKLKTSDAMFQVTELVHVILERCSRCNTTYRFKVTKLQAIDYLPPRQNLIQQIFPELPPAARAVLTERHICGLCLYPEDTDEQEVARTYIDV